MTIIYYIYHIKSCYSELDLLRIQIHLKCILSTTLKNCVESI